MISDIPIQLWYFEWPHAHIQKLPDALEGASEMRMESPLWSGVIGQRPARDVDHVQHTTYSGRDFLQRKEQGWR